MAWDCPRCGRRFARRAQGHECAPAMTLDEYFSVGPPRERPIFEALITHLESIGPVHIEALSVGIFLKRTGGAKFAELRPMQRWVALSFALPRIVRHPLMTRKPVAYSGNYYHVVNLRNSDDLDDAIVGWVTEAYLHSEV